VTQVDEPRPLWDIGRFAVAVAAAPIAWYLSRGEKKKSSGAELRADARARPLTEVDASMGTALRIFAWLFLGGVAFAALIVGTIVRRLLPEFGFPPAIALAILICVMSFASASLIVQTLRWTIMMAVGRRGFPSNERPRPPRSFMERRYRRTRPSPVIRWLCTPSMLDALPAILWTLAIAPLMIADIPPGQG
jgi:hypothetical protein